MRLTTEQVLALAPDDSAVKAGRGLASPKQWNSLGVSDAAVWGEIKGSGATPYRVECDLSGPAFKCSCPSKKFPCKHALGMMLALAASPESFSATAIPDWVAEWLAKRAESVQKKTEKAVRETDPETEEKRRDQREKLRENNDRLMADGLAEMNLYLKDIVRRGLGAVSREPLSFWDGMGRRMVDSKMPGLAARISECGSIANSGAGRSLRLCDRLGEIHLLVRAASDSSSLDEAEIADLHAAIGRTVKESDLLALPAVEDTWRVLGDVFEQEGALGVRRQWLRGINTDRPALLLTFGITGRRPALTFPSGSLVSAALHFHPSASPLRAIVGRSETPAPAGRLGGSPGFAEALDEIARRIAANPWGARHPLVCANVRVVKHDGAFAALDTRGALLPIDAGFRFGRELLSLSGGSPIDVFGEWNGVAWTPVSATETTGRFVAFRAKESDS